MQHFVTYKYWKVWNCRYYLRGQHGGRWKVPGWISSGGWVASLPYLLISQSLDFRTFSIKLSSAYINHSLCHFFGVHQFAVVWLSFSSSRRVTIVSWYRGWDRDEVHKSRSRIRRIKGTNSLASVVATATTAVIANGTDECQCWWWLLWWGEYRRHPLLSRQALTLSIETEDYYSRYIA